jgi:hypothetical protein
VAPGLTIKGTKIDDQGPIESTFVSHRQKLKQFYKNKNYKVITNEGSLIVNSSRDLIERSTTAAAPLAVNKK